MSIILIVFLSVQGSGLNTIYLIRNKYSIIVDSWVGVLNKLKADTKSDDVIKFKPKFSRTQSGYGYEISSLICVNTSDCI